MQWCFLTGSYTTNITLIEKTTLLTPFKTKPLIIFINVMTIYTDIILRWQFLFHVHFGITFWNKL